ncbi:MAG: 23S rRNA pseudouridine(1911/1915/1917) synthase RluD [Gammaproteobacteria bacterium]|nr:23S rRNA pseudouridine(1911/1915/1917) synthase RluD [Gammaproteobacteria bacterium]MCP5415746.1 23S rRNA pseudouridine(1911/1915/1917) synthase RluD [Chromatiaceae bacterium]
MNAKEQSLDRGEQTKFYTARVGTEHSGSRLDQALSVLFPEFSRARLQRWIRDGRVSRDGREVNRPREKLFGGEEIVLEARLEEQVESRPQAIPLQVSYQDDEILVIDKPAGLVVHPAAGNPDGTLQNALLHRDPGLIQLPRAGIVHRLDKDTSGLLVVARTLAAHKSLVEQLQCRTVKREYLAVATGVLTAGGCVDEPIGRHPMHRTRMAVVADGKPAVTHYRVLERFRAHSLLRVNLETGRTHQIRVHMAHIRHPLVGDQSYAGRLRLVAGMSPELQGCLYGFNRQALHAHRLGLKHPRHGEWMEWESAAPADLLRLLQLLRADQHDG